MPPFAIRRVHESSCGLLVIDLQEKFVPVVHNWDAVLNASLRLVRFFQLLKQPIFATEQYPKGLGSTVAEMRNALAEGSCEQKSKTCFSACGNEELSRGIQAKARSQWILCGIEAHVCVQQTAFDLLAQGYEVFLALDAIGSRHEGDRETAFRRLAQAGAILSTSESLMFEILRDATHPCFRQASALIKQSEAQNAVTK